MRKTTNELYLLGREKSWFGRARREERILTLLDQVSELDYLPAVAVVLEFLLSSNKAIQAAASKALSTMVPKLEVGSLLQLQASLRWDSSIPQWDQLRPRDVINLISHIDNEVQPAVLGLLTLHRNGYIRQEALRRLTAIDDGSELPFLLLRQNDWVEAISLEARDVLLRRTDDFYLPHLANNLTVLLKLEDCGRWDHSQVIERVMKLLLSKEQQPLLEKALRSEDEYVRRTIVRRGLETPGDHLLSLVRLGLKNSDPIVRLACCRRLVDVFDDSELRQTLPSLAKDSFPPVRKVALESAAQVFPETASDLWHGALLDSSRSIRELARFYLSKLGVTDLASVYRRALETRPENLIALHGLAETGDAADADYFKRLTEHPLPSRRRLAIEGLSRTANKQLNLGLEILFDENHKVLRALRELLSDRLASITEADLHRIAMSAENAAARENAVLMLVQRGKWKCMPWLLDVIVGGPDDSARLAQERVYRFLRGNKVFTKPSEQQRHHLESVLSEVKAKLSSDLVSLVESDLSYFA